LPPSRTTAVETLGSRVAAASRGVVVAGRWERGRDFGPAVSDFAATAGFPLLGDPLSGARSGGAAIAHYDALLRDERFAGHHTPDLVLRVGDLPTSKALRTWLAGLDDAEQIMLDPEHAWQDPAGVVALSLAADAVAVLPAVAAEARGDRGWLAAWRDADAAAAGALGRELDDVTDLSEPRIAVELATALPAGATLVVASSMPVRDVEGFWPVLAEPVRVLSNRGANGIDGTISTAFGVAAQAAADRGGPVVALIGDVALAHDVGGLLAASRLGLSLTIVLLHNDGGGIFDFLPVAVLRDVYEQHVATPHGLRFEHAAALYGLAYEQPRDVEQFRAALGDAVGRDGSTLIEVRTSRAANVELHQRVFDAVAAVAGAMPD
jgi:2-succinyl-5-enolpyruvyl-6-hydroxy-3-cyclohexene-1-carboxylate synthase